MVASALTCVHGIVCQHHGPLPFTGFNLAVAAVAAVVLVAAGVLLWRAASDGTS